MPKQSWLLCALSSISVIFLLVQSSVSLARDRQGTDSMPIVLHAEGLVHGFLVLRTLEGETLADGDLTQSTRGDHVSSRLVFHFKDSSLHDETVVFSQRRKFRVLSYHLIQKGPAFKQAVEESFDGITGELSVHYTDENGKEKQITERFELPANIANGLLPVLLKNISPSEPQTTLAMLVTTPKPRIVKLLISPEGEDWFTIGNSKHKSTRYVVKFEIGGVAGIVAPIVGKQPQDTHIWINTGDSPAFVKSEGPLYANGPSWRIELASPVWKDH